MAPLIKLPTLASDPAIAGYLKILRLTDHNMASLTCIACAHPAPIIKNLDGRKTQASLAAYFEVDPDPGVEFQNYSIARCDHCHLEFSEPMRPGSDSFYEWITAQTNYYPRDRWEFSQVVDHIRTAAQHRPVTVLDVGCGSGDFLVRLLGHVNVRLVGLDTTPRSVEICRSKGLEAHCCTIETFRQRFPCQHFDFVVSFHCIEHVPSPGQLIDEMVSLLGPGGELVVSAPLSPMSFETSWFDPLNHPPHHLSRFSAKSLQEMARLRGLSLALASSPAAEAAKTARRTLWLRLRGPKQAVTRFAMPWLVLSNPLEYVAEVRRQKQRLHDAGQYPGDTFLARFSRP